MLAKKQATDMKKDSSGFTNVLSLYSVCFAVLLQDNGSAKYFQGTRTGINMGEKVAQVNITFLI